MVGVGRRRRVKSSVLGRRERVRLDHALNKFSVDFQLLVYLWKNSINQVNSEIRRERGRTSRRSEL